MLTMAVNGASARVLPMADMRPVHIDAAASHHTPAHMAEQAAPQRDSQPDCAGSSDCMDLATGQCLSSHTACASPALALAGSRPSLPPADRERPARPAFGPDGQFLTGAPERPPRPLA